MKTLFLRMRVLVSNYFYICISFQSDINIFSIYKLLYLIKKPNKKVIQILDHVTKEIMADMGIWNFILVAEINWQNTILNKSAVGRSYHIRMSNSLWYWQIVSNIVKYCKILSDSVIVLYICSILYCYSIRYCQILLNSNR